MNTVYKHRILPLLLIGTQFASWQPILAAQQRDCFGEMLARDNKTLETWETERIRIDDDFIASMISSNS